jgi:hypothetical protein
VAGVTVLDISCQVGGKKWHAPTFVSWLLVLPATFHFFHNDQLGFVVLVAQEAKRSRKKTQEGW